MFEFIIAVLHVGVAFLAALFGSKLWIRLAKKNSIAGKDMNKYDKRVVAEAGGIAVLAAIMLTLFLYIFFKTFVLNSLTNLVGILALVITMLLAGFVGFSDDILGWKRGIRGWKRVLMTIPIAIPLMVINAGHSTMYIPFVGAVNFGLIYPLILIPLGVIGATNGFNLLAGYNGLETSLGIVVFSVLGMVAFYQNQLWLTLIAGIVVASLIGFLIFNKYPSKLFPGDSLTYTLGALIACFAILGNMERTAIILFLPFIVEGILKARSRFRAENFGKPQPDGSLEAPYSRIYSLTHLSLRFIKRIKRKVFERDVTFSLLILELIIAALVIITYIF